MAFSDEDETIQVTPLDVSNPVGQVGVNDEGFKSFVWSILKKWKFALKTSVKWKGIDISVVAVLIRMTSSFK